MSIYQAVAKDLKIEEWQVSNVVSLQNEDNTVPFIARYRKEKTGDLDEVVIANILDRFDELNQQQKRREYILGYLQEKQLLSPELERKINNAQSMQELEDLYQPYKPRRKTLKDKAIELGMQPLAEKIVGAKMSIKEALKEAANYINDQVPDAEKAYEHACDIVIQDVSDNAEVRKLVRNRLAVGTLQSRVKREKKEQGSKYQDFFALNEDVSKLASHRIMALLRAEKEGILALDIGSKDEPDLLERMRTVHFGERAEVFDFCVQQSYQRHLSGSIGNEILNELRDKAEDASLDIFAKNLEKIILAAPFGEQVVVALDPGIRTGCKAVLLDANGQFLAYQTLHLAQNDSHITKLHPWLQSHLVAGIAIGNGTFGRETLRILQQFIKQNEQWRHITIAMVDEDGASIYSASEAAREEFPDLDVTVRGAISIGRRFQDPMAELVKIDPKSLGVGQYQHDIASAKLQKRLRQIVEWAVNRVGINLNTSGYHLLSYVSGLDKKKALQIIKQRKQLGHFDNRQQLLEVKGIGAKAFEQAAGFLLIHGGSNPLDATGVHPENYQDAQAIAAYLQLNISELIGQPSLLKAQDAKTIEIIKNELRIENALSIIKELSIRGLSLRDKYQAIQYNESIESFDDLLEGMVINGVVDNVVAFGAFIDIGIKENGLVHISEISDSFIKDASEKLAVGDSVRVKILSIDKDRKRIALSIKQAVS